MLTDTSESTPARQRNRDNWLRTAITAAAVLAAAIGLAVCVQALSGRFGSVPARAVSVTGVLFAAILAGTPGVYILRRGRSARPETAALLFLAAGALVLLATYFFYISRYVFFPADILIWSEGDFVNDILKFSLGYPLYTSPLNGDSFHYVPGPQLLTYLLAWMAGEGRSIPAYRVIQLLYTAGAVFVATLCVRRIMRIAGIGARFGQGWLWNAFCFAVLFLVATNSITNRFAFNLHGDALAQLANLAGFYLLLAWVEKPGRTVLLGMAVVGPLGFLTKQNLLVWPVLYTAFLVFQRNSLKRVALFALTTGALSLGTIGACYAIWGQPFWYWIFAEMRVHPISPLRSFQHMLDSWAYFAAGLAGGAAILRKDTRSLAGAWLVWLGLIAIEAYTSGIEWMLNHIGPGSLIAGVWFLAGLYLLAESAASSADEPGMQSWINAGAVAAAVALIFSGMGLVKIPLQPISADAYRYVRDIENQFAGQQPDRVLLDTGTWVYRNDRIVMKDRATSISTLAAGDWDPDFSGFISRLAAKRYSRILIRDFHQPNCWYDNEVWPRHRNLRQAIMANYHEAGTIRAADGPPDVKDWAEDPHLFSEITILEPNVVSAR